MISIMMFVYIPHDIVTEKRNLKFHHFKTGKFVFLYLNTFMPCSYTFMIGNRKNYTTKKDEFINVIYKNSAHF